MISFGPRVALVEKIWRKRKHQAAKLKENKINIHFDLSSQAVFSQ